MNRARKQLKAAFTLYYKRKGVGQRRLSKLVKSDVCAVIRNTASYYRQPQGYVRLRMQGWVGDIEGMASMFIWHRSPEGHIYWANRFGFF
ncbi:hypothetical protein D3C77_34470 [compost metagenome]